MQPVMAWQGAWGTEPTQRPGSTRQRGVGGWGERGWPPLREVEMPELQMAGGPSEGSEV